MLPSIFTNNRNQGFFPTVINDLFNDSWLMPQFLGGHDAWQNFSSSPAINVSEDEEAYKVEVAAPGMRKDDFKITLSDDMLVISMEKKSSDDANDVAREQKKYIRREFSYSKFEQRLALPEDVERQKISAQMNDGVLVIDLPKMAPAEKVQECQCIEIK